MNIAIAQARKVFKGISWRNPFINIVLHTLDPLDYLIRMSRRLSHLPKYSARVRSNGIVGQFGGRRFAYFGDYLAHLLQEQAHLSASARVLEIGCGCGRVALSLAKILEAGNYTGLEIDEISLQACRKNKLLANKRFQFDLMDIYNMVYNPTGKQSAESFVFSYPTESFDIVYLISVFTHMLPAEISNYIKEISRMLKPGGNVLFTTFVMDYGNTGKQVSFTYDQGDHCLFQPSCPEKVVGYYLDFFDKEFAQHGMQRLDKPLFGPWRSSPIVAEAATTEFPQDILIYSK